MRPHLPVPLRLLILASALPLISCGEAGPLSYDSDGGLPAFAKPTQIVFTGDAALHAGLTPVSAPIVSNCAPEVGNREWGILYFRFPACVSSMQMVRVQPTGSGLALRVTDIRVSVTKGKTPTISMIWGVFAIDDATGEIYGTDHIFIDPQIPDDVNGFTLHVDQDELPLYLMDPDTRERIPPAVGTISLWDLVYTAH